MRFNGVDFNWRCSVRLKMFLRTGCDITASALWIAGAITTFFLTLRIWAPAWPVFTIAFVVAGTLVTFSSRLTAFLAVLGLTLYVMSWPAVAVWGNAMGIFPWFAGVVCWFAAVFIVFRRMLPRWGAQSVSVC